MFNTAFSSFSVSDLGAAKKFYEEILKIDVSENSMGLLELRVADGHQVMVYPKPDHTAASFTVLNFKVGNIEKAVDQLSRSGVQFEQYEGRIKTNEKGIFEGDGPKIAWFKDPSGNIFSIIES